MSVLKKLRNKLVSESGPDKIPGRPEFDQDGGIDTGANNVSGAAGAPNFTGGKGQGNVPKAQGDVKDSAKKAVKPNEFKYDSDDEILDKGKHTMGEAEEELDEDEAISVPSWLAAFLSEAEDEDDDGKDEEEDKDDKKPAFFAKKKKKMDEAAVQARTSVNDGVLESFSNLFEGTELSQEFKEKLSTIFESAVNQKVDTEVTIMAERYNMELEEEVTEILEALSSATDVYMTNVAEEWMAENELAVEAGLKAELAESFLSEMKTLFENHYVEVPETKVDLVRVYAEKISNLTESLNEAMNTNQELAESLNEYIAESVLTEELSSVTSEVEKSKIHKLLENVSYSSVEDLKNKVKVIKENVVGVSPSGNGAKLLNLNETSFSNSPDGANSGSKTNSMASRMLEEASKNKF